MIKCLLLVIYCLSSLICLSQNRNQIYFEHYPQEKGLSQGSVYTSVQFDDFLWFGTQDGLNRFDGYEFKVYKSGKNGVNLTQALLNDGKGHMWVGTSQGLQIYYPRTDTFQNFGDFLGRTHPLQSTAIRLLKTDRAGNVWILTDQKGAFYYNAVTRMIRDYPEFSNRLIDISEGPNGDVFVATDDHIYKLGEQREKFLALNLKDLPRLSEKTVFRAILADSRNQVWIGTYEEGLYLLENINHQLSLKKHFTKGAAPLAISSSEITRMLEDSKGSVWIGTRTGGISVFNPQNQNFVHVTHYENDALSIAGNYVLSFSEDRQRNIWVGMSGQGVEKYDPRKYQFGLLRRDDKKIGNSLSDNMVFKIYRHEEYLYFGTQSGGLVRYDPIQDRFKIYKNDPAHPESLLHNEVYDISADSSGDLWLAVGKGLCKFDPKSQLFESFFREGQERLVYLSAVKVLRNKEVWVGGQRGLSRFDPEKRKWLDWDDLPALKAISKYVIRLIYEDDAGDIWLGTTGQGLLRYSHKTKKVVRLDGKGGVNCANIRAIFEDQNSFWFGSDCGAYEFLKGTLTLNKHVTDTTGLPNHVVYGILRDKQNRLWFSTNQGLSVFDPDKNSFKNYNASDGLQSNEFNTNCLLREQDGTMFFGGVNGISYFKPESLTSNTFIAPVKITKIKMMDKEYKDSLAIPYVSTIDLSYNQNFISFEFSVFNFSNSERNTYRYKMDNLEQEWVNAGPVKSANYTNLPPGRYTFRVRGSNNDGVENPREAMIHLHIHPPFWQTIWFRVLLILIFFSMVYLFYRNKVNVVRREEQQKAEIKRIRTEAEMAVLRAQISPYFIFNSLNAIEAYTLTNRRREASHFLQVFSKLIRLVLDNSREELVSLDDDLQALKLFIQLEEERFAHVFRTEFDVDPDLLKIKYQIPPLLIQPFVENAISNSLGNLEEKTGILKITLKSEKHVLRVLIHENGTERESSPRLDDDVKAYYKRTGLDVTIKRIEALGHVHQSDTFYCINRDETGTSVALRLPLLPPL